MKPCPVGFIELFQLKIKAAQKRSGLFHIRMERVAAYGSATDSSWLIIEGRPELIWVREELKEIAQKLEEEQKRCQLPPSV